MCGRPGRAEEVHPFINEPKDRLVVVVQLHPQERFEEAGRILPVG
jgi:hypothetical protein